MYTYKIMIFPQSWNNLQAYFTIGTQKKAEQKISADFYK